MTFPSIRPAIRRNLISTAAALLCLLAPLAGAAPVTPNDFTGSDSERINKAIAVAAQTGARVVVPRRNLAADGARDVWLLDTAILVQSGTILDLENCHLKLSDQARDNFIRSANCGLGITEIKPLENIHIRGVGRVVLEGADRPRATGDSAKTLGERTFGTDAGKAGESPTGDWRNIGILLAHVENFSIQNLHMKDPHGWAISLERCAYGSLRDLDFSAAEFKLIDGERKTILNQDGIDLRQGCHDITIENITGHSGDDLIALTNILGKDPVAGSTESMMVTAAKNRGDGLDDIRNVFIRNVRGHTSGGHHIVRLLNAGGLKIHDVLIDGLIDTSTGQPAKAGIKIGDANPVWGGVTPLGDTYRIMINNVISRAQHTILIGGSLSESVISNVVKYEAEGEPITYQSGKDYVRNVVLRDVQALNAPTPAGEG
ncbi:MAG: hypothetical protein KF886_22020 [Candidatus Hydrogenedentes bacterium]|nr:hypothetical protein [Candidatus Hydrogenedentota bacterium]